MKGTILFFFLSLLTCTFYNCAHFADDEENFGNEDYSSELPWQGETDKFTIETKEGIRLNAPEETAGTAYITTPSTYVRNTRWEVGVRLSFNPSAKNYARFYLTSSSHILSGALNGYFIQIGRVKDNITLYRQEENQPYLLASSRELMKGNNSPSLFIKVECDNKGYWTLWTRLETEKEYTKEKQIKDTQITSSLCCGIYCIYTKSRRDGFTFHHIKISNDVETSTEPEEQPDEPINPETPANPDSPELPENVRGMLLFNEIMYNPASDGAEYIEFYNPSDTTVSISSLKLLRYIDDGSGSTHTTQTAILSHSDENQKLIIPAHGYICFTKSASTLIQKHKVSGEGIVETSKFRPINNDGGYLAITTNEEQPRLIDKCCYSDEMNAEKKRKQGVSQEKKSPNLSSSLNVNWHSSSAPTGGTPGIKNSSKDAIY